jgi:hypothetical protein
MEIAISAFPMMKRWKASLTFSAMDYGAARATPLNPHLQAFKLLLNRGQHAKAQNSAFLKN